MKTMQKLCTILKYCERDCLKNSLFLFFCSKMIQISEHSAILTQVKTIYQKKKKKKNQISNIELQRTTKQSYRKVSKGKSNHQKRSRMTQLDYIHLDHIFNPKHINKVILENQ